MRVTTDKSEAVGFHYEHSAKHLAQDGFLMELEVEGFYDGFQSRVEILDGLWTVAIYDAYLREMGWLCDPC